MASTSAFEKQPAAAVASTGSSMEWLTPDNAASYDYETHAPKQFTRRSSEANLHVAASSASMPLSERSTTPQLVSGRANSRPNTPPVSAGGVASGREATSPQALYRDPLLRSAMNRSSEALSSASPHNVRRPSSSNSPKAPFYLRSTSLGIEDDGGSLHWDPEDRVPSVFLPHSITAQHTRSMASLATSPSHVRADSISLHDRDSREGTSSSVSGASEGGSSAVLAAPAIPAKSGNRRSGGVLEQMGGMLDRFGKRLHSRSEARDTGKRPAHMVSPHGSAPEYAETVFVDDASPSAVAGPSRPFSPKVSSPMSAARGNAGSTHSDAPRSPLGGPEDRRSGSNRSSGALSSPAGMARNLSGGSSRDLRGDASQSMAAAGWQRSTGEPLPTRPLERTLIQVTEDNERFAVVDISGLNSSAAIKERVMSKLHLFDEDPSCFALVRTEIGSSITDGPVLSDDEVLVMCYRIGDDRGSLKFLLQQVRPPAQPSRAAVPPPSAQPNSPRIVLRDTYEASSATNPSTPTTNSRPPRSKSNSLSSHSSIGEAALAVESPSAINQHHESASDANRGFAVLSRPKTSNRTSMAMSSIQDESAPSDADGAGHSSRSDRRRDLSTTADDGLRTHESHQSRRESQAHSSTDAYVFEQRRRSDRHSGSGDTAVSSMRASQPEHGRPTAQRTASHPNPSESIGKIALGSSPSSAMPALPRSLLPGGRREQRLSDTADASQMYVTSPGTDVSTRSAYASTSGPPNPSFSHQVRAAMSTDDMRRRSRLYNGSAEFFQPQLERLQELDPRYREAHLAAAGLGGPRQTRGMDHTLENRNLSRLGVHSFDRERSPSIGAATASPVPNSRVHSGSGPEPWLDPRMASRVPQQSQPQYAQPAYVQSLSGSAPRSRPSPSFVEPRGPPPQQAQYRSNPANAMQSSPRPAPQYPSEFGGLPRPSQGHYNTVPRQHDPRVLYAQVPPQTLQDRSRFRPMHPPSRDPQRHQPPPPHQQHGQHAIRAVSDGNPYVHGHYPASNPRTVSDFQRLAPSQASLTPGRTVQEVFNSYNQGPHPPSQTRLAPHQHATPYQAGWTQSHASHRPSSSASQARTEGSYSQERAPPLHQDFVTSPPRSSNQQSALMPVPWTKEPVQTSRNASADVPASVKYFYNPSTPSASGSAQAQQQASSLHRPQPSTSSQSSSHDAKSASSQRPYTTGTDAMAVSRGSGSTGGGRSSGSSFGSSGAQSHRRDLSSEENMKHNTTGSDSAPTSARSLGESPKPTGRELPLSSTRSTRVPNEEIVDDDELIKMRPLPQPPAGMQYGRDNHDSSLPPSSEGEDTLRAGKLPQNLFGRLSLDDCEDGGTARAESTLRQTSRSKDVAGDRGPAKGSSSIDGVASTGESTEDGGTFDNFDDDDEDDYDEEAGTWAQGLDSQPERVQSEASSAQTPTQRDAHGPQAAPLSPALSGLSDSLSMSTMSPRRPVLTLNIDSTTRAINQGLPHPQPQDAQKAVAQAMLARSNRDAVLSSSSSGSGGGGIVRSTSFAKRDRDWAFRPPPEQLYDNLDEFFPKLDLDKPLLDNGANASQSSPRASSPRAEAQPTSAKSSTSATSPGGGATLTRSRLAPKKSIRLVAQDRKRFLERAEAVEQRRLAAGSDLARRPSTKLWGGRVVEMTPGVEQGQGNAADSPLSAVSSESRPVFKWVKGDLIGKGTYGRVYLALNATTGEMIAVKQVELPTTVSDREDARQKGMVSALRSEIETLKDLDHPNIVSYLGFEETTQNLSIFLEYVPGGSVHSCMRKHGKLDEATIKSFLHQILEGLAYLHGRGILHRDLKGDNLLVDFNGNVKISDFGTVRKSEDIYSNVQSMSMQGSIFWMAPEVVNKRREGYSAKVDIWSLGCVVLEMFAGRRPWSDDEAVQAMLKIGAQARAPPIPPDVRLSKAAAHFLKKCFAVDPAERPTAARLLQHVFPHAEEGWQFSMSSLYRQLHR